MLYVLTYVGPFESEHDLADVSPLCPWSWNRSRRFIPHADAGESSGRKTSGEQTTVIIDIELARSSCKLYSAPVM